MSTLKNDKIGWLLVGRSAKETTNIQYLVKICLFYSYFNDYPSSNSHLSFQILPLPLNKMEYEDG
jgi:hypothetical protein